MNVSDAARLLGYLAGVDNRQPSEAAALAWADALDESITFEAAREAAAVHRAESTEYVQPAHINMIVRRIRRERIRRDGSAPIPAGLSYPQEQAWRRVYHARIGAGVSRPEAEAFANAALGVRVLAVSERPVGELVSGLADRWRQR